MSSKNNGISTDSILASSSSFNNNSTNDVIVHDKNLSISLLLSFTSDTLTKITNNKILKTTITMQCYGMIKFMSNHKFFYKICDHANVPMNCRPNPKLGYWVNTIRKYFKVKKINLYPY